ITPRWAGSLIIRVPVFWAMTLYSSPVSTCRYQRRAPSTVKTRAMRTASERTRTCMLPLVRGGVSTFFLAGAVSLFLRAGDRSNLYPPTTLWCSNFSGDLLGLHDQPIRVVRQRAGLQRHDVTPFERPCHGDPGRLDHELLEDLVDVALAVGVDDDDPVPGLHPVEVPEGQEAVRAGESESVPGDVDVSLPIPRVAGPPQVHPHVPLERSLVCPVGVGHLRVLDAAPRRDSHLAGPLHPHL